jgi:ADP-ribosylglycohydrolase
MIVVAGLLYGEGDFGKSICTAVGMAFDTDCNGATVGSIMGMRSGIDCIGKEWIKPINGKIHTSIFGVGTVEIEKLVEKTLEHIKQA